MKDGLFISTIIVILMTLASFLIVLPFIPIAAVFVKLTWNMIAELLQSEHMITYLQSLKLCFYLYIVRGILGIEINIKK